MMNLLHTFYMNLIDKQYAFYHTEFAFRLWLVAVPVLIIAIVVLFYLIIKCEIKIDKKEYEEA